MSFPINLSISVNEVSLSFPPQSIKLIKFSTQKNLLILSFIDSFLHISQLGLGINTNERELHTSCQKYFNSLIYLLSRLSPFQTKLHINGSFW